MMISARNRLRVVLIALTGLFRAGESLVCQSYAEGRFSNVTLPGNVTSAECSPNTTICATLWMAYNTTLYSNFMTVRGCNNTVVSLNHPGFPTLSYPVYAMGLGCMDMSDENATTIMCGCNDRDNCNNREVTDNWPNSSSSLRSLLAIALLVPLTKIIL